jgi:transposase
VGGFLRARGGGHGEQRDLPEESLCGVEEKSGCFEQQLLKELQPRQGLLQALQTIPGLDRRGAAMSLVEIGDDMQAFGCAEKLAAWAGVCPGNNESAGKRRKGNP